ncbi:MAG: acyltransferase family protein [Acidimicrobiales bacterium]
MASVLTYTANWYFVRTGRSYVDLFASPSPVQHFWSLAVEEQFYLVLPIVLVVVLRRPWPQRLVVGLFAGGALLSTAWMAYLFHSGAGLDRIYYGTDTRMSELLVGGLLAVVLHRLGTEFSPSVGRILGIAGAFAYAVSLWAMAELPLTTGWVWGGGMVGFSLLTTVVLLGILSSQGPLRALAVAPLRYCGRISYGLYVYHWPLFLWLTPKRTGLSLYPLFALRVSVTFAVAALSFHLVEAPIRNGWPLAVRGRSMVGAAVLAELALLAAAFVVVSRPVDDPFATLRQNDSTLTPPVTPADGVLDLLVITDAGGAPVIDRLEALADADDTVSVRRAPRFDCTTLVRSGAGRTCANWVDTWPELIADQNPDIVLLFLDDWPTGDLERLAGKPGADLDALATEVLDGGFDLLTARGAPVLWSASGADFTTKLFRSGQPLFHAMEALESSRTDVRRTTGTRLPDPAGLSRQDYLDQSAAALLADASLYQRTDRDRLTKVMVVGDSQARSLGYGLERWGAENDRAVVWNVATEGCGILTDGTIRGFGSGPVSEVCARAVDAWPRQVASFDPDIVVVLTSIWDLQDRQLPGWPAMRSIGDPEFDEYVESSFERAVDVLTAGGAHIVWMKAPCSRFEPAPGQSTDLPDAFDPARSQALNRDILQPLAKAHPDVDLFDLDRALCPGGRYTNTRDGVSEVRVDGIHFSVAGAAWFAETYGDEVLRLGGG